MATKIDLTFDCSDALRLAEFWKLALGYIDEPPPAPFATREDWLRHHGVPEEEITDEAHLGDGAWLCDPAGVGPRLSLLRVPEPKVAKNRLHIDVRVAGTGTPEERWARVRAEIDRLTAAGATVLRETPGHHAVLADPEGNEFCVC